MKLAMKREKACLVSLLFYFTDNPFRGLIEDAKVQDYWNKFGTPTSAKVAVAGFPDFLIYKICEGYLYGRELELQFVEGNGNCLPNSILKQVNFAMDPG